MWIPYNFFSFYFKHLNKSGSCDNNIKKRCDHSKKKVHTRNDINISRRFFVILEKSAEITDLDVMLTHRFKAILELVSSGHKIYTQTFKEYCNDTAKLYVDLYPWHTMPSSTVHKVLIHWWYYCITGTLTDNCQKKQQRQKK